MVGKGRVPPLLLLAWKWRCQISKIIATVYSSILSDSDLIKGDMDFDVAFFYS
jgi:hypothetical protein